ncbi:hypothetical protein LOAG_12440, partial [Loa loa]
VRDTCKDVLKYRTTEDENAAISRGKRLVRSALRSEDLDPCPLSLSINRTMFPYSRPAILRITATATTIQPLLSAPLLSRHCIIIGRQLKQLITFPVVLFLIL